MKHSRHFRPVVLAAIGACVAFAVETASCSGGEDPSPPDFLSAKPMEAGATDDELRRLLIERRNTALEELQRQHAVYMTRRVGDLEGIAAATHRFVVSSLDLESTRAGRIRIREQHVAFTRAVERDALVRFEAGAAEKSRYLAARYHRLDAEIALLKVKRSAKE